MVNVLQGLHYILNHYFSTMSLTMRCITARKMRGKLSVYGSFVTDLFQSLVPPPSPPFFSLEIPLSESSSSQSQRADEGMRTEENEPMLS